MHTSCFRICVICYDPSPPAVEPGIEFRSQPFTLLSCDFYTAAKRINCGDALMQLKPPMKPATVRQRVHPISAADEHLFSISGYCFVVRGPEGAEQGLS